MRTRRLLLVALLMTIGAARALAAQPSRTLTLGLSLPEGFPQRETAIAVVCRDGSGRWGWVQWRIHASPPSSLSGGAGSRCRIMVRPSPAVAYLASDEFVWGERANPIRVQPAWLRTVRAPGGAGDLAWVGVSDTGGVECDSRPDESRCLFVPVDVAGVIVAPEPSVVRFAMAPRGAMGPSVAWKSARSARLVRILPPGGGIAGARAITIEPALKQGAGHLREARAAPAVVITRLDAAAFWVEGNQPRVLLELRHAKFATLRLPLESLSSAAAVPFDVRLAVEEVIEGEVRSRGLPVEGATVILSRLIDDGTRAIKEDDRPIERMEEIVTDAAGRFRFAGLARERYEVLAVHPAHGRARAQVMPSAMPRLLLKPRAVVRGRVVENGVPVSSAVVQMLPMSDAVAAARNPILLASEPVRTGVDGRFEAVVPEEGRVVLAISAGRSSRRLELGDARSLGEIVEIGDIRLEEPREFDVFVDLPEGCRLQAAGPLGVAGLSVLSPTSVAPGRWRFAPPSSGRWVFAGICGTQEIGLDPAVLDIRPGHRDAIVLKVRR